MMDTYENDKDYFIEVTPIVDEKNFLMLLLADMASKKERNEENNRIARLPKVFKKIIDTIMTLHEELVLSNFSFFINIKEYYESKTAYEINFDRGLYEALQILDHSYDPVNECVSVIFTDEEIKKIKSNYKKNILDKMDPISTLMNEYISEYTKENTEKENKSL